VIATRRLAISLLIMASAVSLGVPAAHASPRHIDRLGAPSAIGRTSTDPLADPTSNTNPSSAFVDECEGMTTSKHDNDVCDAAALKDFDAVRAGEGLGPMVLPGDFDTVNVPSQLLAISTIERVDRGLVPVVGRSTTLDVLAQGGANTDNDPEFPTPSCHCNAGGANWAAAGNSALLDDFYWMYDDGLGSFNEDCTASDMSGCWGHRHDIINAGYAAPVVMGAGVATTGDGTSMATEYLGGDTTDAVDVTPTWATIAATMPLELSARTPTVITHNAKRGHATVKVTVAYTSERVTVTVLSGSKFWSVTPKSCRVAAGRSCTLRLSFHSAKRGTHRGKLRVTGPAASRTVKLIGHRR
jgi:hypothetical protein